MLTSLEISNFKCFDDIKLPLGALTLLSGLNGSGKSTSIQALLLCKQSLALGFDQDELVWNGDTVEMGRFSDIVSFYSDTGDLSIGVCDSDYGRIIFKQKIDGTESGAWSSDNHIDRKFGRTSEDFRRRLVELSYISAERWGPRVSLPVNETEGNYEDVGKNGEFVAQILAEKGQGSILSHKMSLHPLNPSRLLDAQVEAWLSEISPGIKISAREFVDIKTAHTSFRYSVAEGETRDFRPTNVGFGISYALPVIVALLNSRPGQIVIVENPEAHLHPAGQTAMGRLMAMAADAGLQIICETHSDHVLDGVRIAVKDKLISPEAVICNFFSRSKRGHSEVVTPKVNEEGRLSEWPAGFFDQSILNLAKLNSISR